MTTNSEEITVGDLIRHLQKHSSDLIVRLHSNEPGSASGGFLALDVALQHLRQEQEAKAG